LLGWRSKSLHFWGELVAVATLSATAGALWLYA
jgi:hypothetical protein